MTKFEIIVDILTRRILNKGINPITGKEFQINDIKIEEYKTAVENEIIIREEII